MKIKNYTDEQAIEAIKSSSSIRQVLCKLNLVPKGGSYKTIKRVIKRLNVNTSHFIGQGWSKNKIIGPRRTIEDYLTNKKTIHTIQLKKRLINEEFFAKECCSCHNSEWLGEPIPLELHHIDGNSDNNALDNLQLLCPNCHALTPNYRGRKNKKPPKVDSTPLVPTICEEQNIIFCSEHLIKSELQKPIAPPSAQVARKRTARQKKSYCCKDCGKIITHKATRCRSCASKIRSKPKIQWPETSELILMVENSSYLAVGRQLGVSDNAIRKHLKNHTPHNHSTPKNTNIIKNTAAAGA